MNNIESNSNTFTSNNLDGYLKNHRAEKGSNITHTKIPNKDLNIYGGSYNIENNEEVHRLVREHR